MHVLKHLHISISMFSNFSILSNERRERNLYPPRLGCATKDQDGSLRPLGKFIEYCRIVAVLPVIPYTTRNNWQHRYNSTILYEFAQRPTRFIQILICTAYPVHTNICNFRGDLFKIRIQLQVLLKKFIKSNRIAETYSYQTTLKNFFFPFRSTKVSKETASLNSFQDQSFRMSIQNQRPKYISPPQ